MKSRLPLLPHELSVVSDEICSTAIQKKWLEDRLKLLIKEVYKMKKIHGLVTYPDLQRRWHVREVLTGECWKNQVRQRRRVKQAFPNLERGAIKHHYAQYLIIKLGELYVRLTGKRPTRGGTSSNFSKFERFAYPIYVALGIGNFRNRVREYISWRKDQGL
jgi:hypothetical protein